MSFIRMMRIALGCACVVGYLTEALAAQEPRPVLTLARALEMAKETNPTYRQAYNSAGLNDAAARTVLYDQVLPRAQLNLFGTGFTGNLTHRATDNFGNPIERPVSDWVYYSDTQQSLSLSWRIQGASIINAWRRQGITARGRELDEVKALTDLDVAVGRRYMAAMEQRALLVAEEALVEARRVDLEVATRLFSLALKTRVDVLNAELGIEQQSLVAQQQRAAFAQAKLALRTQLGDEALEDFDLADEPLPIFDPSVLDVESLVATAMDVNPGLRQAGAGVDLARVGVAEAQSAWWPTLYMNLDVSRVNRTESTGGLFNLKNLREAPDSRFQIGLQFPMFNNYFQNRQTQAEAGVEMDNSRERDRDTRLRVEETVRSAMLELENQWESLRLAGRSAEIAQEALRLAGEEYRIGARTFGDLRQSIDAEANTRRQVIKARHTFVNALLTLEEAVGTQVTPPGVER